MSFDDWYRADKDDPNGRSAGRAGMETGMAIGSLFGPVGAGIGAAVGGVVGGLFGSNGARKRARRKATNNSYAFAQELFTYAGETRAQINKEYDRNLSTMTARVAATGATIDDTFNIQKGKLVQTRDSELADLEVELDEFRKGPNYEWLRKDFELVAGVKAVTRGSAKHDEDRTTYSIGGTGRSSAKYTAYNQAQRNKMVSWTSQPGQRYDRGKVEDYHTYAGMIKPSLEMYEKKVFGDDAAKKEYNKYINDRIDKANEWWEKQTAVRNAENERIRAQEMLRNNRGNDR